jgi:hypothetical protein
MARRGGTAPKDGPLVMETFKENGWWLSRTDSRPYCNFQILHSKRKEFGVDHRIVRELLPR